MNKKKILIIVGIVIALVAIICLIFIFLGKDNKKLNELELNALTESGKKTSLYFDKLLEKDTNGVEEYICFALFYSENELNKNTLTSKEISNIIKEYFNLDITEKRIEDNGLSPLLVMNSISFNDETKIYNKDSTNYTQADIAHMDVSIYLFDKAKKQKDKYVVTFKEYTIIDPYKVLNYYQDLNDDENVAKALDYLKGKSNVSDFKKLINSDMIEKVSELKDSIDVTYIIKDNKLLIDSIS
ncbi:MAG: hypothetical protein OSJ65_02420 [Bacilli bacterium]|nr:hypothetical protein [Bacilli bacterium]